MIALNKRELAPFFVTASLAQAREAHRVDGGILFALDDGRYAVGYVTPGLDESEMNLGRTLAYQDLGDRKRGGFL